LFQWASTMKIQQSVLFLSTADNLVIISLKLTCSFHDIAEALFLCRYSSINHSLKTRERTWWRLFQKRVVLTKIDIYVFIKCTNLLILRRHITNRERVLVVIVYDSWKSENITSVYWCLFFSSGIRGFLNQCFKYRFKDWLIVCC
jgi:hypothetical protein